MRKTSYYPYFFLIIFLLFMLSLSKGSVDRVRNTAISSIAPTWINLNKMGRFLLKTPPLMNFQKNDLEKEKLFLENNMLKNQINGIYEWLFFENRIEDQVDKFKILKKENQKDIYLKDFFQRRAEEIKEILKVEYLALPAKVIFRSPTSWSSSLWINVGDKNNEEVSKLIIAKNSPVVLGQNLIGVVEYVGYNKSRVRLITDAGLIPSVRALRGGNQDKTLLNTIESLKDQIYSRDNLFSKSDDKQNLLNVLFELKDKLSGTDEGKYLAKGEIFGSAQPLWRSRGSKLKGVGFNYDYADEEGNPRDLRSGKLINDKSIGAKAEPLLQKGDLLETTGMDGIFPKGLQVAIVSKVNDLDDGDFAYDIEAKPTCSNLNELEVVLVLPPIGFDQNYQ